MMDHLLTILVFFPLLAGLVICCVPKAHAQKSWWVALGIALIEFCLSIVMLMQFDSSNGQMQLVEKMPWVAQLGISYFVGVDGISLWLLILTTWMTPLVILCSVKSIQSAHRLYYFLVLALETFMLGTFVALDVFIFYIFWEVMLLPMLLIIGIWGGENRIYAAIKFFLYTLVGSLVMLVAIFVLVGLYKVQMGAYSLSVIDWYALSIPGGFSIWDMQSLLFFAFMLAFAVKVPLFPLHTWLPDAHVQAPTGGSVILAGILLKMGTYAMLRFVFPLFPQAVATYASFMIGLGIVGIIYGALVAMVQPDLKKLVAYSSVSHLGFCIVGMFALNLQGLEGSVYQMLTHGVGTGALFTIVGCLYERFHTREIEKFGGLAQTMPYLIVVFMIVTLSSIGLPTTAGFVGEFFVLFGAYTSWWGYSLLAGLGVILGAIYMLWMFRRVCFGQPSSETVHGDMTIREWIVLTPYVVMIFVMGLLSPFFFKYIEPSIKVLMERISL